MAELHRKSFNHPDNVLHLPGIDEEVVDIGEFTVAKVVQAVGWVWSRDMQPLIGGGDYCEARHVGLVVSGRWGAMLRDGTTMEFGPDDVFDVPPGHDGYTVGDDPCVLYEWSGVRSFIRPRAIFRNRVLATLLFTDLVDSTGKAVEVGDAAWRDLLAQHLAATRAQLERFYGREVSMTGDGILALFDGPALAIRCGAAICESARGHGLRVRAGVHVGEVELAGATVHGVSVHEAARIMSAADADQVVVSDIARALAEGAGLHFDDLGERALKGLDEPRRLFRYRG
jgi:class 3 adenylate cyclase